MNNSILTAGGQAKLLGSWLMYLSVPVLYVALSKTPTKESVDAVATAGSRSATAFKIMFMFGIVPAMMAWFSTRPSIYATKTSTILGLVGLYVGSWFMAYMIDPEYTTKAIDPNENAWRLAGTHAICCASVAVFAAIYVMTTGNALVNAYKIGGGYNKFN